MESNTQVIQVVLKVKGKDKTSKVSGYEKKGKHTVTNMVSFAALKAPTLEFPGIDKVHPEQENYTYTQ